MPYSQAKRFCSFQSPLGADALMLRRFEAAEAVSGLFTGKLLVESERADIDPHDVIGRPGAVKIETQDGGARYFHGIVTRFEQHGRDTQLCFYQVELRPQLWLLTRRANCRIFQQISVPEIVQDVLGKGKVADVELQLQGSYADRDYCVQYRETDFAFVSRLLEEEGIFYYFVHEQNRHLLVLTDNMSDLPACPGGDAVDYHAVTNTRIDRDVLTEWTGVREMHPGKQALKDYNFEDPGNPLLSTTTTGDAIGSNDPHEIFDYQPEKYRASGQGDRLAKIRMQELEALGVRMFGHGTCRAFVSGHRFELNGHFRAAENRPYMITQVRHRVSQPSPRSGTAEDSTYENEFSCIPAAVVFRPERATPKPFVRGPQTAVVVGPAGEEIHLDKYGRVKVQFHWDREGKLDDKSSCWVRVSQAWAGQTWGAMAHPRVHDEVIVEFLEGDPDKPIVTGCVYNAKQMPPYDLSSKANWTRTGIKTRSSPGGGDANFNEIRLDDKKGEEELYFHAEKNQNVVVENDQSTEVGHDQKAHVGNDRTLNVDANETTSIAKDQTISVGEKRALSVGKSMSTNIGEASSESVGDSMTLSVAKNRSTSIGESLTLDVGKNATVTIGGTDSKSVAKSSSLQAQKVQIVAQEEISLVAGGASITLKKSGDITINGTKITIKGSSDVIVKGSKVGVN